MKTDAWLSVVVHWISKAFNPALVPVAPLMLASFCSVTAADPTPALQSDLIWVNYPLHVLVENGVDPLGVGERRPLKASICPRVKSRSNILREPTFDVTAALQPLGVDLPKGSQAIFSPGQELLFIHSTADDLELTRVLMTPMSGPKQERSLFTCDLRATLKTGDKEKTALDIKSAGFISGQMIKISAAEVLSLQLIVEPVIGPDGESVDLDIEATVRSGGKSLSLSNTRVMQLSKPAEIILDPIGDSKVTLSIQVHRIRDYWGPEALESAAKKAEALKEIEASFKTAP